VQSVLGGSEVKRVVALVALFVAASYSTFVLANAVRTSGGADDALTIWSAIGLLAIIVAVLWTVLVRVIKK
jgi:hypothetical protein